MSTNPVVPKQDVPKELRLVVTTLTDEAQNAALQKCKELGFDTNKGPISLEETFINLSDARDILLDAVDKRKLIQLPLKLQYALLEQTQRSAQALTSLVNGTDSVTNLVTAVDELTASIWQFNLRNLSGEVLGLQNKLNQLKIQETRIREVSREAEGFKSLQDAAKTSLSQITEITTTANAEKTSLQTTAQEIASILAKVTEHGQKIGTIAAQVDQHGTTAAQQLAACKQASADTEVIAKKSKELQAEIDTTRNGLQDLTTKAQDLISSTQTAAASQMAEFKAKNDDLQTTTQTTIGTLTSKLESAITEQASALNTKVEAAVTSVERSGADLKKNIDQLIADTSGRLTQAETSHESTLANQIKEFTTESTAQLTQQSEAFNVQTAMMAGKSEEMIKVGQAELQKLTTELGELENRIRVSIERATGYTLFHSFQKRQLDLAKSKQVWGYILGGLVVLSLFASGAFIYSLKFVQVYNAAFYLKLSISVPLIYGIAFCNVQYSRERRLEEEYAFKSNISISLEPYQKLVEKLVDKNKPEELAKYTGFIIESVSRVFTSPTEHIFEAPGDHNTAEKLIKACGDFIEPVVKGLRK